MLEALVAMVAPPRCGVCARGCELRRRLCTRCERALRRLSPHWSAIPGLDETWSAAPYEGPARDLVAALKFGARTGLAEDAAGIIGGRAPVGLLAGSIVPVPGAPVRRRKRGFDSAEAIAGALAGRTGLPIAPCLARTQGRRQVGRPRAERIADPPRVRVLAPVPSQAVLVDDVVTTGATLGACAAALRGAGTIRIVAITLAASMPARDPLGLRGVAA
jgi:predicted amidophosphoribosyltransferase